MRPVAVGSMLGYGWDKRCVQTWRGLWFLALEISNSKIAFDVLPNLICK
jgi:hypothetical protein